jgi:hypothetical protein
MLVKMKHSRSMVFIVLLTSMYILWKIPNFSHVLEGNNIDVRFTGSYGTNPLSSFSLLGPSASPLPSQIPQGWVLLLKHGWEASLGDHGRAHLTCEFSLGSVLCV